MKKRTARRLALLRYTRWHTRHYSRYSALPPCVARAAWRAEGYYWRWWG